jgi:hypothetical protein
LKTPRVSSKKTSQEITKAPDVTIQPHISIALETNHRPGIRKVEALSNNTVPPNKKRKKSTETARYGSTQGLPGPKADFDAPIVRSAPRGVFDIRQLLVNGTNNEVPDEFGVTNKHRMPMQNMTPTLGGKYSGRTGPIH